MRSWIWRAGDRGGVGRGQGRICRQSSYKKSEKKKKRNEQKKTLLNNHHHHNKKAMGCRDGLLVRTMLLFQDLNSHPSTYMAAHNNP